VNVDYEPLLFWGCVVLVSSLLVGLVIVAYAAVKEGMKK